MTAAAPAADQMPTAMVVDDVIARGDLSKLTPEQRVVHYHNVCDSLKMNPLTQPFQYMQLQGKLVLYARKDAADQLRKINGIKIEIIDRVVHEGVLTVHVRATDKTGRSDEDFGSVSVANLRGEAVANAFMKAVTKAKRRVTLSLSGLGYPDESEIEGVAYEHRASATLPDDMPAIAAPAEAQHAEPRQLQHPEDQNHWRDWAQTFVALVRASASLEEVDRWIDLNKDTLTKLGEVEPKMGRMLGNAIDQERIVRGAAAAEQVQ